MYRIELDQSGKAVDFGVTRIADRAWIPADEANPDWQAYRAWVEAGNAPVSPVPRAPVVPDGPTLSDWRVGLALWGRLDDVTARVAALMASKDGREALLGRIARERLEYANTVLRDQLMQLKDAFGFTAAEIDESLWRAEQVRLGDLSGTWPVPAAAKEPA